MVAVTVNNDMLPKFQLVRSMDFGWQDQYVFDVTANSQYAIASASDNLIRLYDLATLQPATSLTFHQQRISKIKLFSDQFLFSASEDGKLARWDLRTSTAPVQVFDCKCSNRQCMSSPLVTDLVKSLPHRWATFICF